MYVEENRNFHEKFWKNFPQKNKLGQNQPPSQQERLKHNPGLESGAATTKLVLWVSRLPEQQRSSTYIQGDSRRRFL